MDVLHPGTTIAGRYAIERAIGSGAMGTVYAARRIADGVPVAVKVLKSGAIGSEDARRRFEREAKALAATAHPNIVSVIELGAAPEGAFLVTELLSGSSLEHVLAERRLTPALAIAIADQVLAGLAHAHALGIVHRDVKPANVHVAIEGERARAKLLDFGLAKFADQATWGPQSMLTSQGAIVGTPAYMAAEQVFGPVVDARTDVYAAGVLLFELLTGTWPFVTDDNAEMIRAHALTPPPALGDARPELAFRPELDAVVAQALAKRPDDRWPDARAMRDALARVPRPAAWDRGSGSWGP